MINPELLPTAADLRALQLALDSMELTPNETLLLLAAGPALSEPPDPIADLANAVNAGAPLETSEGTDNPTPLSSLLDTIAQA